MDILLNSFLIVYPVGFHTTANIEMEVQPFLGQDEKDDVSFIPIQRGRRPSSLGLQAKAIFTHGLVAIFVLIAVLITRDGLFVNFRNSRALPSLYCELLQDEIQTVQLIKTLAPLTPAIEYRIDKPPEDYWSNDLYFGEPSDESERAWNSMIHRKTQGLHSSRNDELLH